MSRDIGWVTIPSCLAARAVSSLQATRHNLSDDLREFDRGWSGSASSSRLCIPILFLDGYGRADVMDRGCAGCPSGLTVVLFSGDKALALIRLDLLLNRYAADRRASRSNGISVENANERLGVPPRFGTDYLALVGDSSDSARCPGIGERRRATLSPISGRWRDLDNAPSLTRNGPRGARFSNPDRARSQELVTSR